MSTNHFDIEFSDKGSFIMNREQTSSSYKKIARDGESEEVQISEIYSLKELSTSQKLALIRQAKFKSNLETIISTNCDD